VMLCSTWPFMMMGPCALTVGGRSAAAIAWHLTTRCRDATFAFTPTHNIPRRMRPAEEARLCWRFKTCALLPSVHSPVAQILKPTIWAAHNYTYPAWPPPVRSSERSCCSPVWAASESAADYAKEVSGTQKLADFRCGEGCGSLG
jgi:hypothetical protein